MQIVTRTLTDPTDTHRDCPIVPSFRDTPAPAECDACAFEFNKPGRDPRYALHHVTVFVEGEGTLTLCAACAIKIVSNPALTVSLFVGGAR